MPTVLNTERASAAGHCCRVCPWVLGILATAFPLVMSTKFAGEWAGKLFAWVPAHPSTALTVLLMPFIWMAGLLGFFGYVAGTGILTWCVARSILGRPKSLISPAIGVPLLCNIYIFLQALPLLELPQGSQIRPGGWAVTTFLPACGLTIYGAFYAARQLRAQENKIICAVGILLGLLPIPTMLLSLQLVVFIKGFRLEP